MSAVHPVLQDLHTDARSDIMPAVFREADMAYVEFDETRPFDLMLLGRVTIDFK